MVVPAAMIKLDKTDSTLDQSSGQQAVVGERSFARFSSVHFMNRPQLCRQTDRAAAALVRDLKQRGLLESTLVIWGG